MFKKYADARADRVPEMTIDEELLMTCAKTMKTPRWQHMNFMQYNQAFIFHSIRSVLIAKLKTERKKRQNV